VTIRKSLLSETLLDILAEDLAVSYPEARVKVYSEFLVVKTGAVQSTIEINFFRRADLEIRCASKAISSGSPINKSAKFIKTIHAAKDTTRINTEVKGFIDNSIDFADFLFSRYFGEVAIQKLIFAKPIQLVNQAKAKGLSAKAEMIGMIEDYSDCLEHRQLNNRNLVYRMFILFCRIELSEDEIERNYLFDLQIELGEELSRRKIQYKALPENPCTPYKKIFYGDQSTEHIDCVDVHPFVKEATIDDVFRGMRPDLSYGD